MRRGPREQPLWGVTGEGPEHLCYLGRLPGTKILDFVNAFVPVLPGTVLFTQLVITKINSLCKERLSVLAF